MAQRLIVVYGLGAPTRFSPTSVGNGVGGYTVRVALEKGLKVRAVARNPDKYQPFVESLPAESKDRFEIVKGDVSDAASLEATLQGATGAVFAVQASDGVSAYTVDRDALKTVAIACAAAKAKLIVISSALVSRKNRFHPIRGLLNTFIKWGMMDAKIEGEDFVRAYPDLRYTIIRPASLLDKPRTEKIAFNQGDAASFGMTGITREDVGLIAVEAAISEAADKVTFECMGGKEKGVDFAAVFSGFKKDE